MTHIHISKEKWLCDLFIVVGYLIICSMEYHKIDETFMRNGQEYRVVDPCKLCDFHDKCGTSAGKFCDRDSREDGVDVIYKKVKGTKSVMYQCMRFLLSILFGIEAPVEKKETESNSYARKKCKSCDWYSQTQSMCNRYQKRTNPLDSACSKYIKRYRRGK